MNQTNTLDVRALLDSRPIGTYQKWIVFLCFFIVVMDGFDVALMGFTAPALQKAWQWSHSDLAPVLSAALFGLSFGALAIGPLADRFGRRKVLIACVAVFGLFTLLASAADSKTQFIIYRFIAGFAMGGVMPMAAALVREYSPAHRASLLITIVFAGFTLGAAGGAFLAAWMIPSWGWQSMFYLGGITPLLLALFLVFTLPESLTFLVHKGGKQADIRTIVERCAPNSSSPDTRFTLANHTHQTEQSANPIATVLNPYYRFGSLILWSVYFLNLFLLYLLSSWMPTMIKESGMNIQQATVIYAMFQFGGPFGSIIGGWLMDRFEAHRILSAAYIFGAVMLAAMGLAGSGYYIMCLIAFAVGAGFNGGSTGMNALSSNFFPVYARATGNSWMHGIGRIGAILSSFAGAWMLNAGWNFSHVALFLCLPALLIVILLCSKYFHYQKTNQAA